MSVSDTFIGTISDVYDRDWIAVDLVAGQRYTFALTGNTLFDPVLRLYFQNGSRIAHDDDSGTGRDPLLTISAPVSGRYYIEASGFGSSRGAYDLALTQLKHPAFNLRHIRQP